MYRLYRIRREFFTFRLFILYSQLMMCILYRPRILKSLIVGHTLEHKVRLFWPQQAFDQVHIFPDIEPRENNEYAKDTWVFGQKGSCYIGVMCTKETFLDSSPARDSHIQVFDSFIDSQ